MKYHTGCIFRLSEDSEFNKSHFIPAKTVHIVNACNNITSLSSAVFETEVQEVKHEDTDNVSDFNSNLFQMIAETLKYEVKDNFSKGNCTK